MIRWAVGVTVGAFAAAVVAAFGVVVWLLTAWQPVEDEEWDDDGDADEGGDRGDDDTEGGDSDG